jgi:hypothetical protein
MLYPATRCLIQRQCSFTDSNVLHDSEGNDGPWSTFDLRVGEPAQYLRVLVSTASPESIVALAGQGCSQAAFTTGSPPSGCESSRGNLFNPNQSSTWRDDGQFYINDGSIGLEANLGYQTPAQWGLDTVGLGLTGPNITNSTVGAVATTEPFYLYVDVGPDRSERLELMRIAEVSSA